MVIWVLKVTEVRKGSQAVKVFKDHQEDMVQLEEWDLWGQRVHQDLQD
jgi:hypothetical protein